MDPMVSKGPTGGWFKAAKTIKGFLLDISGVLFNSGEGGGVAIPGSVAAVKRLREANIPVRFCTNETTCTAEHIVSKLCRLGFDLTVKDVFPPAPAMCSVLRERGLRPHLLVHADLVPDFDKVEKHEPNCVVIGDAQENFTYENMTDAFRLLKGLDKPLLFTMGRGKYYQETDGLKLDVGPFMKALEYACDVEAEVVGKPSKTFFLTAVKDMGLEPADVVMIGDDIVSDVGGAQACGIRGVQVRTGKYRPADEPHPTVTPDGYVDNLAQAVDLYLAQL